MRKIFGPGIVLAALLSVPFARGQEGSGDLSVEVTRETLRELRLLEPAWDSAVVNRESGLLLVGDDGVPTVRLAFPAAEILEVRSADGETTFDVGDDLRLDPTGTRLSIERTHGVQTIREAERFLPVESPMSYRHRVGDPETGLLYAPGRWFHDRSVEVTYVRADRAAEATNDDRGAEFFGRARTTDDPRAFALPRTLAALREGRPLTIGISGDSISTGLDASYKVGAPPNQTGYAELVVAQLREATGSEITLVNLSVAGWSVANGIEDLAAMNGAKPDLLIVAYGMNDVGRRDPDWFRERTAELIAGARAANPEVEIVLVATMLGNADWIHTPAEMFPKYRDELQCLTGPGIALADLTEVWTVLLERKDFLDLTGNGLNHPNDFGHRLYAQAILRGLLSGD
ncbi:MAG TPA: SGNH/GDSL hydrolase family protein [Pirellulaceae bacterium]|nr:SGNH/GDSL hydrolase family protein [Pirellulaceae bacterium]